MNKDQIDDFIKVLENEQKIVEDAFKRINSLSRETFHVTSYCSSEIQDYLKEKIAIFTYNLVKII